jgi:hypothetical protein
MLSQHRLQCVGRTGFRQSRPLRQRRRKPDIGVLETRRGSILVRNREALRIRACLCNESVKNHFEEVLRGVYPGEADHSR